MTAKPDGDQLPALPLRRRVLIVALAIAAAAALLALLIYRPGDPKRAMPRGVPEAALCTPDRSSGCVGGRASVHLLPASAAASQP